MNYLKNTTLIRWGFLLLIILQFTNCEKIVDLNSGKKDPESVFNEVWTQLDKRYALFQAKQINWDAIRQQYQSKISPGMSDNELFIVIANMLETLKDGHVVLMNKTDTVSYDNFYKLYPINFNFNNILTTYLKNDFSTVGPVIYKIVDNVGYIYYESFENDISEEDLDKLMSALKDTKGLILDIRSNPGGRTENADRLAGRFFSQKTLVKYEQVKKGVGHNDFFEAKPFYITPSTLRYNSPVILLTNRSCYSACNDFVLYFSSLPQVQRIGDQTGGGGSIPHNYILSNGWKIQYSSSITLSPDKKPVEDGIKATININISAIDEVNGLDPILEKAFIILR